MSIRILCVGDVVGRPGRSFINSHLKQIRRRMQIDVVVVNAENAAGGSGLTPAIYDQLIDAGAHLITLGDHVYGRDQIIPVLERSDRIVRPANLPPNAPGKEYAVWTLESGVRVAIITVLGRLFMKSVADCPFRAVDRVIEQLPEDVKIIVVECHAEATSEKVAMGWHLDGRVSIVFGTHTHIPTADERVLPQGTAYITDLGMTGPYDSILGRQKERVLGTMITTVPSPFGVATEDVRLCGLVVDVDPDTARAQSVERFCAKPEDFATP